MRKIVVIASACGLLAINAAALMLLIGPLAPGSTDGVEVLGEPALVSQVSVSVTPTGDRPPGVQDMAAALASVGATPEVGSWPSWCGTPPETPWKSFGVTENGTHVGIVIASAGDGARLWKQQSDALTGCTQFRVVASSDSSLTLRRTDVPVTWVVARRGDVLVSVLQVSDSASTQSLDSIASSVVERTAAQCIVGSNQDADDDMTRNPWRPGYRPWHPAVAIDTPEPAGPKVPKVSVVVEWAPTEAVERPELAVIAPPDLTNNPYTMGVEVAPVVRVPVLISPSELLPPAVPRPAAPPPEVEPIPTTATAYFAREDSVGPGCGWAFAGTVPPEFDPKLPGIELEGQIDGAFSTAASKLSSWLMSMVDARAYAREDAQTRAALAAWALYDKALERASAAWQAALIQRGLSLDAWYAYVPLEPLPIPSVLPTQSPTDAPSVAPTASPGPSALAMDAR
ncbi:MAG: hypothetical protein Q8M73_07950 [Actinomycetota bacterium]|nr:hypothetical protein [Actinomycetota bacterium]